MKFFYSAGAMGLAGEGHFYHSFFKFPKLPFVTKTITKKPKTGHPYAIAPIGNTVYNKVALSNCGLNKWLENHYPIYSKNSWLGLENPDCLIFNKECAVSIAGTDDELQEMVYILSQYKNIASIELNFSCPNVKNKKNKKIPNCNKKLYLKLNHKQDPYAYDLNKIIGIRVNSVPTVIGGKSGKGAQKDNWAFIEKYNKENLNVAGCSVTSKKDVQKLKDMGCKEIGIGSLMLTNPSLVMQLVK